MIEAELSGFPAMLRLKVRRAGSLLCGDEEDCRVYVRKYVCVCLRPLNLAYVHSVGVTILNMRLPMPV